MNYALATFRLSNQISSFFAPNTTARKLGKQFQTPKRYNLKEWENDAESKGQRFYLKDGVSAIRWNPGASSKVESNNKQILLVHGWESRGTQMYAIAEQMVSQGYSVVAVDMPAHGHSAGETSNPYVFAKTIELAQKELGKFDAIVGHSMGAGAIAFAFSRGVIAEKMVLISSPSSIERVLRRFSHFVGLNNNAANKFVAFIENSVGLPVHAIDSSFLLRQCDIPTLLIHDEGDLEVPVTESERLATVLSNAELYISKGLGHRRIIKSEEILKKINNFIVGG